MKRTTATALTLAAVVLCAGGCTTYYSITDPVSSKEYFTTKKPKRSNGAVIFKDDKSTAEVQLSSAEVRKISKDEYKAGTGN